MIPDTHAMPHEPITQIDELDDDTLIVLSRGGDNEAFSALYDRYVYSARRLARHLGQREESDDVVADAFARILDLLQRGKGPDRAFRAYLFTTIRHESGRRAKAVQRVRPTDDDQALDAPVPFGGGDLDAFEKDTVRSAYESLPERWRTVLWHLDVEGRKPAELAELLDMSPNGVSALVYRARSALRSAYLQAHVGQGGSTSDRCDDVRPRLAAIVRRTASTREQETAHAHLADCSDCMRAYLELRDVNRDVGLVSVPVAAATVTAGGAVALAHAWLAGKGIALVVGSVAAGVGVGAATVTGVAAVQHTTPPDAASQRPLTGVSGPAVPGAVTDRSGADTTGPSTRIVPAAGAPDAVHVAPTAVAQAAGPSTKVAPTAPAPTATAPTAASTGPGRVAQATPAPTPPAATPIDGAVTALGAEAPAAVVTVEDSLGSVVAPLTQLPLSTR